MSLVDIILIAIGLAMDCFAVSITQGMSVNGACRPFANKEPWLMAFLFGLFQGGMPLIGYAAGSLFADFVAKCAPWLALIILAFIGGKMIYESLQNEKKACAANFNLGHLVSLSVATSIDALATGIIFIPVPQSLLIGLGLITIVSFLFSIVGYAIGAFVGQRFHFNVSLLGGSILILIGMKIFIKGVFL